MSPYARRQLDRGIIAIIALATVAVVAMLTHFNDWVVKACILGIGGIGGFSLAEFVRDIRRPE